MYDYETKDIIAEEILLTGATGFLGTFLLDELIRTTTSTIICIVRRTNQHVHPLLLNYIHNHHFQNAATISEEYHPLLNSFLKFNVIDIEVLKSSPSLSVAIPTIDIIIEGLVRRVKPIFGDLSKSKLGLKIETWRHLCKSVDMIIHNGCVVNSLLNYEQMKNTNVNATKDLLLLSATSKLKVCFKIIIDLEFVILIMIN